MLPKQQHHSLLHSLNATAGVYPRDPSVDEAFTAQARRTPEAVALSCGPTQLTYRALDEASEALAQTLLDLGVPCGAPVGLCAPYSTAFVLGALGILKAGGAYLPLDPSAPAERLRTIVHHAELSVVLTSGPQDNLPPPTAQCAHLCLDTWRPTELRPGPARPQGSAERAACVLYAPEGPPSGVLVPHRGVQGLVQGLEDLPLQEGLSTLLLPAPTFDASTFEIWAALLHGGTCVIYPEARVQLPQLQTLLSHVKIDCLWLTSALYNTIVDTQPEALDGVRYLLTGGDAPSMPQRLRALDALRGEDRARAATEPQLELLGRIEEPLSPGALPVPEEAPRTATEQALGLMWQDLLHIEQPSLDEDFFDCGGHSLKALTLVARIADQWHCDLPLRAIFEAPTLAAMARNIDGLVALDARQAAVPLTPAPEGVRRPLSFSQERIWFLERMEPDSAIYNIPRALRISGRLDVPRFAAALNRIVERHEALRTVCTAGSEGEYQRVLPARAVVLSVVDLSAVSDEAREQRLDALLVEAAQNTFDLRTDQTLRAQVIHLGPDECLAQVVFHHGSTDGWSLGIFWRELAQLYPDPTRPMPPLPLQYGDYAYWQRRWLDSDKVTAQLKVLQARFTPLPEPQLLPADRPRREVNDTVGARRFGLIPQALVDRLNLLAQAHSATLFMVLLSGLWVLLHRLCEQEDVVVGSPIAGRHHSELEDLIGFFVNNVAFRGDLSGSPSFASVLAQSKSKTLEAYENQDVPFEKLVEVLQPDRSLGTTPLYQVMLALLNTHDEGPRLPGLSVTPRPVDQGTSLLDLSIFLEPCPEGLAVEAEYRSALFNADSVDRWMQAYQSILSAACDAPQAPIHTLPLMNDAQREQLEWWGQSPQAFAQTSLPEMVQRRRKEAPEALAVCFDRTQLTREELGLRVDQLAGHLAGLGVHTGDIVALHLERGIASVVAILATVQAGAIYLPLEPQLPSERRRFILNDAAPCLLISEDPPSDLDVTLPVLRVDEQGRAQLDAPRVDATFPAVHPDSAINLIYTSGSTGQPKGVLGAHRSVLNRVQWTALAHPAQPGERWAHKTALAFVDAVFEVFGPLALGVPLEIIAPQVAADPARLLAAAAQAGVTRLVVVPSLLEALLDIVEAKGSPPALQLWTTSGEPLTAALTQRFFKLLPGQRLLNLYGSTETGADATAWLCDLETLGARAPIGRPISNLTARVLDPRGALVPIGVPGELYVGGYGLAVGYHARPELNAALFTRPRGSDGPRLFRTGDRARWRPDGQLEYWGRGDRQVKLRGARIELGEVETALLACPGVREAAAIILGEGVHRRLVGYVSPQESAQGIHIALREHLPKLQTPSQFVGLHAMPRTTTGKLDRLALPEPSMVVTPTSRAAPRDEVEARLLTIWREVLEHPISVDDDFFAVGGHSLLAVRLFTRIEDEFKVQLPLPLIFHAPRVRLLAQHLRKAQAEARPWDPLVPIQTAGHQPPLFLIHPAPGTVLCYGELARLLGTDQPIFGLQARGIDGIQSPDGRIESMAEDYLRALSPVRGHGPVRLGGWSMGGIIALEMARQLRDQGIEVQLVLLFDTHAPSPNWAHALARQARTWVRRARGRPDPIGWVEDLEPNLRGVARANMLASIDYRASTFEGRIVLIQAQAQGVAARDQLRRWRRLAPNLEQRAVHGTHGTLLGPEYVKETAQCVRDLLT